MNPRELLCCYVLIFQLQTRWRTTSVIRKCRCAYHKSCGQEYRDSLAIRMVARQRVTCFLWRAFWLPAGEMPGGQTYRGPFTNWPVPLHRMWEPPYAPYAREALEKQGLFPVYLCCVMVFWVCAYTLYMQKSSLLCAISQKRNEIFTLFPWEIFKKHI